MSDMTWSHFILNYLFFRLLVVLPSSSLVN